MQPTTPHAPYSLRSRRRSLVAVLAAAAFVHAAAAQAGTAYRGEHGTTPAERCAAAIAVRRELQRGHNPFTRCPEAATGPSTMGNTQAPCEPPAAAPSAADLLAQLDAGDAATRTAAAAQLAAVLERSDRPVEVVRAVLGAAAACWPRDPCEFAVPLADGSPSYAAAVLALAARTGDRDLVVRLVRSVVVPPADAPAEDLQRARAWGQMVLRDLGLAAPHVDRDIAAILHRCYAEGANRLRDAYPFGMNAWLGGVYDVVFDIFPRVPDDLVPWYASLLAGRPQLRWAVRRRLEPRMAELDESRAAALFENVNELGDATWLLQTPHTTATALASERYREQVLQLLARSPLAPRIVALPPVRVVFHSLPYAVTETVLTWIAAQREAPLGDKLAAFRPEVFADDAPQPITNLLFTALGAESVDPANDLATLRALAATSGPQLGRHLWRRVLELAVAANVAISDAALGIECIGDRSIIATVYALHFWHREPATHAERMDLVRHPLAAIDAPRLRAWFDTRDRMAALFVATNATTLRSALELVAQQDVWSPATATAIALLTTNADAGVRAAAYRAFAARDPATEPLAALVAEAEFDVDPLVRAVAAELAAARVSR